ncbi:MAG: hypothetical protein HZR80_03325 [Candidatus Heimdallarchaeota archaeon]
MNSRQSNSDSHTSLDHQNSQVTDENQIPTSYKLDNAATIFSLVTSSRIPCLFRMTATLKHSINVGLLQQTLENIIVRFPYYRVNLQRGLFWNYWEYTSGKPTIIKDSKYPSQKMPITKKGIFPFRVRAFYNRIAVEFHHSITDGTGALTFLKSLVSEYLRLTGLEINDWQDIFRPGEEPHKEEYEDAFRKNYHKEIPDPKRISKAFHLPYKLEPKGVYNILTGIMPIKQVLQKSKELNVTLTEYLTAIYLDSLQEVLFSLPLKVLKKNLKPIRLMVPVNLRRIYPSKTMRNFSLYVAPFIDPRLGKYSFEEILKQVYHYMRLEVSDKYINQQIARNVRGELNPIVRYTPLFLKKLFGKVIYNGEGEFLYSGVITNLGKVSLPEPLNNEISDIHLFPAPSPVTKTGCAVVSYEENLYISWGRTIKETIVEKTFFRKLVKEGIEIRIETN